MEKTLLKSVAEASSSATRLLAMLQLPGVGPGRARKLLEEASFSSANVRELIGSLVCENYGAGELEKSLPWSSALRVLDECDRLGIRVISVLDPDYPAPLKHIRDYPPLVYLKGNPASIVSSAFAVVGTRECSSLGASWASKISELLCERGFTVVSGLALGIDTAAHEGALCAGGCTVAVLAHGLHIIAPKSNIELAEKILDTGGALVSEHPPSTPPRPPEFVRRNRIQSGLSLASIIVESGENGGSMHQARFTVAQGRMLYVVAPPEDIGVPRGFRYEGARRLIQELQAIRISDRSDLLVAITGILDQPSESKDPKTREEEHVPDVPEQTGFGW